MRNIRVVSISKQMVNFCFTDYRKPQAVAKPVFQGHVTFDEETRAEANLYPDYEDFSFTDFQKTLEGLPDEK